MMKFVFCLNLARVVCVIASMSVAPCVSAASSDDFNSVMFTHFWNWSEKIPGSEDRHMTLDLHPGGRGSFVGDKHVVTWKATGPSKLHLQFSAPFDPARAVPPPPYDPRKGVDIEFNSALTSFEGLHAEPSVAAQTIHGTKGDKKPPPPPAASLTGQYAGGTNFGVGGTERWLHLSVGSNCPVVLEVKFVGIVGKRYAAGDPITLNLETGGAFVSVRSGHFRTDGATRGIIGAQSYEIIKNDDPKTPGKGPRIASGQFSMPGEFRGWAAVVRERNGKVLASSANPDYFMQFAQ